MTFYLPILLYLSHIPSTKIHQCSLSLVFSCRACVVVDDRLYLIGGQEGDFMAKPGSPIFKCSRRNEVRCQYIFYSFVISEF